MTRPPPYVRHDAFDFIEDVQRLRTTTEIMDATHGALGRFGFQFFCFNLLPDKDQTFEDVLLANRLPEEGSSCTKKCNSCTMAHRSATADACFDPIDGSRKLHMILSKSLVQLKWSNERTIAAC